MTEHPNFDYSKLRGRIVEKYGTQGEFAESMGMSEGTLSSKLALKTYFTADEVWTACKLLDIRLEDVAKYFFNRVV